MNTRHIGRMKFGGRIALSFALAAALAGCNKGSSTGGGSGGGGVITTGGGNDAIATVNGDSITRDQVRSILETTNGPQILGQLVQLKLIEQELKKQNITVPAAEIQAAYDESVAKQGAQETFKRLTSTDEGKELIKRQLAAQLGVDYLITKNVKVDEAKLKAWFDKRKADYGTPAEVKVGVLGAATKVRADALAQQLKSKSKTFPQLVEEQKKANDPVGQQLSNESLTIPESRLKQGKDVLATTIAKTKAGEVSAPVQIGPAGPGQAFAIISVLSRTPAKTPDLSTMRAKIEQDYKLEQIARGDLKNNFDAAIKQVQAGMAQQAMQQPGAPAPAYRDVLQTLVGGAKAKMLDRVRSEAKVDVPDALYASVAQQFKATPAPGAGATGGASAPGGAPAAGGAPASGGANAPAAGNAAP